MANVRPKRTNKVRVEDFEESSEAPPVREEPQSFFYSDYSRMHSAKFAEAPQAASFGSNAGIKGPSGCTLETLVSTLATLQFVTKGKVDADGKFELVFCSPEPVVSEVKTSTTPTPKSVLRQALEETPVPVTKQDRYVEVPRERHHRHKRSRRPLVGWIR